MNTVLLAEDDPAAAEMLEILLGKAGYEVRVAGDGAAALRLLESGPIPDIALLDWMLPEMSGVEVCRRIRERWNALTLPVLMVTAKADTDSKAAAFAAGANDYITKPFFGAELRARVAAHLRVKQLSEERRALDEHLREREKLSTLGLLVSGVAHDLNNPLSGISGFSQLLLEQEVDDEKRFLLQSIMADVSRCNRIVADLLSFARRHAPERKPVDLAEIVERTFEMRERQLQGAGIDVEVRIDDDLSPILADGHQLQQVFLNLLLNAEHAVRAGGTCLRITGSTAVQAGGAEFISLRFYNDGPPIPESVLERIFEPFFTTKGQEEGTGLGLSICQRIVNEHGGEIEVESDADGTTFTIRLPVWRQDADQIAAAHLPGEIPAIGRVT